MSKYTFRAQRIYTIFISVNTVYIYSFLFLYAIHQIENIFTFALVSDYTDRIRFLFFLPSF